MPMTDECVADAHTLLWFLEGNPKLGAGARHAIADPQTRIVIPAIALAEACRVAEKGKTTIPSPQDLLTAVDADGRMSVEPVDRDLIERSLSLTVIGEIHDRLIVATAMRRREQNTTVVLLSADADIRRSGLIPTRW
jgi:PIN domain nuclease of toxin-antitoxin system